MKRNTLTKKEAGATLTIFSLMIAVAVPTIPAQATTVTRKSSITEVNQSTLSRKSDQIAQLPADCRRSSVQAPIAIRREPSFQSQPVAVLQRGTRVAIQNRGANGWVPVYAPYQGYVYAGYLTACDTENPNYSKVNTVYPTPQLSASPLCRRVFAPGGLNVRPTPGTTGAPLGVIANGSLVTIENPGQNGWVPITAPLGGYISANFLTVC